MLVDGLVAVGVRDRAQEPQFVVAVTGPAVGWSTCSTMRPPALMSYRNLVTLLSGSATSIVERGLPCAPETSSPVPRPAAYCALIWAVDGCGVEGVVRYLAAEVPDAAGGPGPQSPLARADKRYVPVGLSASRARVATFARRGRGPEAGGRRDDGMVPLAMVWREAQR